MKVLAIFTSNEITKEMYESLRKEIGWEAHPPPGAIFHAAGVDEAGHMHVADVWESAEALKSFVDSRLLPAMQKLRISPPTVSVYPAVNINAYPAVEKLVLR
ncbi:MAG: hypothetical protein WCD00_04020 [Desulfuromonadaceae bacterium]